MRPGSLDWQAHLDDLEPGPSSLEELFRWPENALNVLRSKRLECLETLKNNLVAGCSVITHYSGKGTAEAALADISDYLCQEFGLSEQPFRMASACDMSEACRRVLCSHASSCSAPRHVFGDILDRIPAQTPPLSKSSPVSVEAFLEVHGHELYNKDARAFCYKHMEPCRLWDGLEEPEDPGKGLDW